MIVSNSNNKSGHFKTSKLTIFTSINQHNINEYKLNRKEYDLKEEISSPIDSIFRICRDNTLRGQNCDIYLIVTEQLELKYFSIEFGILN